MAPNTRPQRQSAAGAVAPTTGTPSGTTGVAIAVFLAPRLPLEPSVRALLRAYLTRATEPVRDARRSSLPASAALCGRSHAKLLSLSVRLAPRRSAVTSGQHAGSSAAPLVSRRHVVTSVSEKVDSCPARLSGCPEVVEGGASIASFVAYHAR